MASEPLVFISYERDSSRDLARYLHDRLQQMGADIFLDVEDIEPGANWEATLERKIIGCRYLLLLLAPETLSSEWVRREIQMALRHHKEIIPLFIRGFSFSSPVPDEAQPLLERIDDFQGIKYDHDNPAPTLNKIARRLELPATSAPAAVSPSSSGNQQADGTIIGQQANYGTPPLPPFRSAYPEEMGLPTLKPPPLRSPVNSLRPEVIVAVIGGLFALLAGAIAIIPQLQQNQMAQQAIDATAAQAAMFSTSTALAQAASVTPAPTLTPSDTPTHTPEPATNTPLPPTNTPAPSLTPVPPTNTVVPSPVLTNTPPVTTSGVAVGGQAEVRGSNESDGYQNLRTGVTRDDPVIQQVPARTVVTIIDGPVASEGRIWWKVRTPDGVEGWTIESSATRQTLVPVERTAALRLIVSPESLTLVVVSAQAINLNGLGFLVTDGRGGTHTVELASGFDILQLTRGIAEPGTCFVAVEAGKTPPLPSACTQPQRVYRRELPRADVFWYDFVGNYQRDVAILRDGNLVTLCAAAAPECLINYN